jgi:hypothetical protein
MSRTKGERGKNRQLCDAKSSHDKLEEGQIRMNFFIFLLVAIFIMRNSDCLMDDVMLMLMNVPFCKAIINDRDSIQKIIIPL